MVSNTHAGGSPTRVGVITPSMSDESKGEENQSTRDFLAGRDAGLEWAARIALDAVPPGLDVLNTRVAATIGETCVDLASRFRSKIGDTTEPLRVPRTDEVESYIVSLRSVAAAEGRDVTPYEAILSFIRNVRFDRHGEQADRSEEHTSPPSDQWRRVSDDTAFAPPFGTIRVCRVCGCLVAGGPSACVSCAQGPRQPGLASEPKDHRCLVERAAKAQCDLQIREMADGKWGITMISMTDVVEEVLPQDAVPTDFSAAVDRLLVQIGA